MAVILVLIIALGVGLAAASGSFGLSSTRHAQQQAYYTALSSTKTIAEWLMAGGDKNDDTMALLEQIDAADESGVTIAETGLPADVGTCTVNLRYLDEEQHTLKITSTASFADTTETVSLTLQRQATKNKFEDALKVSDFVTDDYVARAGVINGITSGGIVPLYEPASRVGLSNSDYNERDLDLLNRYILEPSSDLEARWTHMNLTTSSDDFDGDILGTSHHYASSGADIDDRHFTVPINGRITIDPMEDDTMPLTGSHSQAGDLDNTKLITLAIDKTANKNVLFRLASGTSATQGNLIRPDDTTLEQVYKGAYDAAYSKTIAASYFNGLSGDYRNLYQTDAFVNRSEAKHNSLLMLNFKDNAGSTENLTLDYPIKHEADKAHNVYTYTWHPTYWNKMDLFVQSTGEVTSNILLGPFGHKYDSNILDYLSYGNYVDNWHGTTPKEFDTLWPYASGSSLPNRTYGLPAFSVDFGKNAHFWILDGNAANPNRYFRIMQGANIIEGSVYSTRATIIGGALIRERTYYTTDKLNTRILGYADQTVGSYANYVEATTRYSQLIYNTDIILKAPATVTSANPLKSTIRCPDTWRNRIVGTTPTSDKNFDPTMIIQGGTIYVGAGQQLTIQGTSLDNMWIAPDQIVVAKGGTLIIERSSYTNVLTDIYVDGGTLITKEHTMMKGNIYVYNDGVLDMQGPLWLDTEGANVDEQLRNGVFIYGPDTVDAPGVTAAGHLTISSTQMPPYYVNGDNGGPAGPVHLVGGDWADLVNAPSTLPADPNSVSYFLCSGYDPETGRCQHFLEGNVGGGWTIGAYGDS